MRIANLDGRLTLLTKDGTAALDVATASRGRFGPSPAAGYGSWQSFVEWARDADLSAAAPYDQDGLGPVSPLPRQVFAVGLNYVDHTAEAGFVQPEQPMIFTKFPSCLYGPRGDVVLPGAAVDWEVELVVVIGTRAERVAARDAWSHVAGLTVGQDLSERALQLRGAPPQFSLAKSYPRFGPIGPYLTTLDDAGDPADLTLTCTLNGEVVQRGNTRDMVFDVPDLVAYLSAVCPLYPGDLIFTGTPPGVGMGRNPPRYLAPGDILESTIDTLGGMRHTCV
ncbi:fumarylacetoacetate hydrolase family protein [Phytohabitans sp. ZYX-F-186]|uniref:Fumarylacetoacetate hydrolase family protein n=1 Tax=Phytohabitans maris TaxID=3071409 RepID=A0ABU0ZTR4_9ACTN|nr:fumarylacetoacetate hydrolase family protein [Phytohabitans sp. ZYX-F-186]MDQ7910343.1 fumarylacetoacetate hydrolase family protein [Phytohabitans sp. ZYX-F-186]